jgi:ribosomal protein S12 methylthiotransferase
MGQLRANGKDAHEAPAAEEGNIIVINTCGFIDKAETVNMILEYADKRKRFSRQGFCNRMFVGTLQT